MEVDHRGWIIKGQVTKSVMDVIYYFAPDYPVIEVVGSLYEYLNRKRKNIMQETPDLFARILDIAVDMLQNYRNKYAQSEATENELRKALRETQRDLAWEKKRALYKQNDWYKPGLDRRSMVVKKWVFVFMIILVCALVSTFIGIIASGRLTV